MYKKLLKQKDFFLTNETKSYKYRLKQLCILKELLINNEQLLLDALKEDLNKSYFESFATEFTLIYEELNYQIKNLKKNMSRHRVKSPLFMFKSSSYYIYEPYGQVLIISPFNYPLQLAIIPIITAIATGNVISLKLSSDTDNTSKLISKLIQDNFSSDLINVLDYKGGKELINQLLEYRFDLIMFTGSTKVGKIIYEKAAKNLTPVILELGGKSPCIVDKDANLKQSARKIVWGKLINAGQTCIAPDYLLVHSSVKNKFIEYLIFEIERQYGKDILNNDEYPKIINKAAFNRLTSIINNDNIIYGGDTDSEKLIIGPTLVNEDDYSSKVMSEEIFGPILPIMEFKSIKKEIKKLSLMEKPLVLYYFGKDKKTLKMVERNTSSGGIVFNDVFLHVSNKNLPFGGVGNSGISSYHGKYGFISFSHCKSIVRKSYFFNLRIRYAPFNKNLSLLKRIIKK